MIIRFKLISALLLLASFVCALPTRAQGGQATPIRSAATLPATCTAGTATVPADLINMAGNLYLCTATNVWTQVPAKTTANTWTQKQTFSADPLFGSVAPWTDVRAYPFSAVCDGTTDSTTGIVATFTSLATSGGTAFLPDGCKLTPPSTLPASGSGFYAPIINLGGQLNLTSTLHLNNYYTLACQNPALRNPANFGAPIAMEKFCPILSTTAFGFTPLISEESNAFVLKDLYLNLFCGSGLKIFPTGNGDVGTVENVFSQGGNCSGNSSGVEQDYGFGIWYKGGGFTSSRIGTAPSMWFHSLAAMDPPGSLTTLDHTYMAAHGIRFDTSGSSCSGSGISSNFISIQQLYENANQEGHTPADVNSPFVTYDIAHCTFVGHSLIHPEMVDATGFFPLVKVENSTNSSFQAVYGEFLLNPVTDGAPVPFFNAQPSSSSGAPGGQLRGTTVFAPGQITNYLGLYGYNCSYFVYITTGQINCNAQTNLPVADIAGHAIGMASPASDIICTASTMGGALATGTYYVIAAAEGINAAGSAAESVLSNEYAIPVTGPTGSIACGNGDTNGIFPFGATGIRFYYGTAGTMQESVYERGNPTGGNYNTFTIVGSGAVSATPAQLTPNPATMAVTDVLQGQYETVAMSDRVTYPQPACFGIGGRCTSLGNFRTQIFGNAALRIGGFDGILTHANTGTRTYTLPDVSGTVCLTTTGCGAAYSIKPCGFVITGTGAGGILQNSDMGPTLDGNECLIDAPSTVVEIDVSSDAGTPSIILGRNRGGTVANLVSSALAAAGPSVTACARTTAITCQFSASTASATLQNTALTGGSGASDWLGVVSGTADGVAHRITVYIERSIP